MELSLGYSFIKLVLLKMTVMLFASKQLTVFNKSY